MTKPERRSDRPFSLYEAIVPSHQQILGSVVRWLDKAEAFDAEHPDAASIIEARLAPDMLPFGYQIKSTVSHSLGAINDVRQGHSSPDRTPWPTDFEGLRAKLAMAQAGLAEIAPEEMNGFVGRAMRFSFGDVSLDFTAENFLLSYAQPNFYFHATTAYALLRANGVKLGKTDFVGKARVNH